MKNVNLESLVILNNYLLSKVDITALAFKELSDKMKKEKPDFVVIAFTYNYLEVLFKKGKEEKVDTLLFKESISEDEIEDTTKYFGFVEDYIDDPDYWILFEMSGQMIEGWIMDCFDESEIGEEMDKPIYYKQSWDSQDIIELKTGESFKEKYEFNRYHKSNQDRCIDLLPPHDNS